MQLTMEFHQPSAGKPARGREGWQRIRGGCGGTWLHRSGWKVQHCGHPTALWPYYGIGPKGEHLFNGGRAFAHLIDAQLAVEDLLLDGFFQRLPRRHTLPHTRRSS